MTTTPPRDDQWEPHQWNGPPPNVAQAPQWGNPPPNAPLPPQFTGPTPAPIDPSANEGKAIAALCLGVLAALGGWFGVTAFFALPMAIVGIILGAKSRNRSMGKWGLALSIVAIVVSVASIVILIVSLNHAVNDINNSVNNQ